MCIYRERDKQYVCVYTYAYASTCTYIPIKPAEYGYLVEARAGFPWEKGKAAATKEKKGEAAGPNRSLIGRSMHILVYAYL